MTQLTIEIEGSSVAKATSDAQSLENQINLVAPLVSTKLVRSDPSAQDFGSSLVLVLGTPAVIALAKGIADWLKTRATGTTSLKLYDKTGLVLEISSATSGDVRALVEGKLKELVGVRV